ncbi:MAG: hypothetical protein ACE37H_04305 [Phycisphaeraceae bacterium]
MFPKEIKGDPVILVATTADKHWPKGYTTPEDGVNKIQPVNRFAIVRSLGFDDEPIYRVYCLHHHNNIVTSDFYFTSESAQNFLDVEYGLVDVQWHAVH